MNNPRPFGKYFLEKHSGELRLTKSSMGARTHNLGDFIFLYTGLVIAVHHHDVFG